MITLQHEQLVFRFQHVDDDAGIRIDFQRTLQPSYGRLAKHSPQERNWPSWANCHLAWATRPHPQPPPRRPDFSL